MTSIFGTPYASLTPPTIYDAQQSMNGTPTSAASSNSSPPNSQQSTTTAASGSKWSNDRDHQTKSSYSNSYSSPLPPPLLARQLSSKEQQTLEKQLLQLELLGVLVGESREVKLRLLEANNFNLNLAIESYFASKGEEDEVDSTEDGSEEGDLSQQNGYAMDEERKGDMVEDMISSQTRPSIYRSATSSPFAAAAASISSSPVTPARVEITVRSDSELTQQYVVKSERPFNKLMADFTDKAARRLEFFYQGRVINGTNTPKELRMGAKEFIDARAPRNVKRNFVQTGASSTSSDASTVAATSSQANGSQNSDVSPSSDAPPFKRAKSDPLSTTPASAATAASAEAALSSSVEPLMPSPEPPFKPAWSELLLGDLIFQIRHHSTTPLDDKGRMSSPPLGVYSSLPPFMNDYDRNNWGKYIANTTPRPTMNESMSEEEKEELESKWVADFDTELQRNIRVFEILKSWVSKAHAIKVFLKLIGRHLDCADCQEKGLTASSSASNICKSRNHSVMYSMHASISLLPGAHGEYIPDANYIFGVIHPELNHLIERALPEREEGFYYTKQSDFANLLELSVRTKFKQPPPARGESKEDGAYPMDLDDSSTVAPASAAAPTKSKGRKSKKKNSSSSVVKLSEHDQIRGQFGLEPEEDADDELEEYLNNPALEPFIRMTPQQLSHQCGLKLTLRDYQQQTVLWALKQEAAYSIADPYWSPIVLSGHQAWYSPFFQRIRFVPLLNIVGGMISEEMGLGKTIEMLALMNLNPYDQQVPSAPPAPPLPSHFGAPAFPPAPILPIGAVTPKGLTVSGATLIVVPTSLVGQWMTEISTHSSRPLKIAAWYGPNRLRDVRRLVAHDVILTTFKIVLSEFQTHAADSILNQVEWHRIIIDESHSLKDKKTKQAKYVFMLHARRRWLLSGTPLTSQIEDIFSQFAFFHMPVLGYDNHIASAIKKRVFGGRTYDAPDERMYSSSICWNLLITMFTHSIIRHKKNQPFNERPQLITLPKRTTDVIKVIFSPPERAQYEQLRKFAKEQFSQFRSQGQVVSKTLQVLALLQPQRQACSAGYVKMEDMIAKLQAIHEAEEARRKQIQDNPDLSDQPYNDPDGECVICLSDMDREASLMTVCRHVFCGGCILPCPLCPLCRTEIVKKQLKKVPPKPQVEEKKEEPPFDPGTAGSVEFTAKVETLVKELRQIRDVDVRTKSLVFSQFTNTIRILERRLRQAGFGVVVINGSMSMPQRKTALDRFINDDDCTVFLMSIRAGAVGLTLTAAQHVFMMEPSNNPALTQQAINRVHRVGQTKEVFIHHLLMTDSIEEKIYALTKDKLEVSVEEEESVKRITASDNNKMKLDELTSLFQ